MPTVALLDACVLYPFTLRDTLIRLAVTGLIQAKWSNQIDAEWLESLVRNGGNRTKLLRTRDLMHRAVLDWEVAGFERLIPSLKLPDADDRHVLAAAIECGAHVLVTTNGKHFPAKILKPYNIEPVHPDSFVLRQLDDNESLAVTAFRRQRASLRHPPLSVEQFLAALARAQLPRSAKRLGELCELI